MLASHLSMANVVLSHQKKGIEVEVKLYDHLCVSYAQSINVLGHTATAEVKAIKGQLKHQSY